MKEKIPHYSKISVGPQYLYLNRFTLAYFTIPLHESSYLEILDFYTAAIVNHSPGLQYSTLLLLRHSYNPNITLYFISPTLVISELLCFHAFFSKCLWVVFLQLELPKDVHPLENAGVGLCRDQATQLASHSRDTSCMLEPEGTLHKKIYRSFLTDGEAQVLKGQGAFCNSVMSWQQEGGCLPASFSTAYSLPSALDPELHCLEACLAGCHTSMQPTWAFPELASAPDQSLGYMPTQPGHRLSILFTDRNTRSGFKSWL